MKTNYRQRKKLKEQARLTRQAEKRQRRNGEKVAEGEPTAQAPALPLKPTT